MNIEEAKNQRDDISLEGRIEEKGEARTVNTRYGETQVCDSYLVDETGRIKLTLWGDDTKKVNNGDMVSIQGAYRTIFRYEDQLNIPKKNGKLEKILDKHKLVPPLEKSPTSDKSPSKGNDETYKPREDVESLKQQVKSLQQQVKSLQAERTDLQKGLLDLPVPSHYPNKNKRFTDKKAVENAKSDLNYADLRGMDLTNVKLSDAKLSDAKLNGADLTGADLSGADLSSTELNYADLNYADLSGADLRGAVLYNADLNYAIFSSKTDLSNADLTDTNRRGCRGFDKAKKDGAVGLDMKKTGSIYKGRSSIGKAGGTVPINFHDRTNEF